MDSIESTFKWEDQFLEMDLPNNSSSDDDNHLKDYSKHFLQVKLINIILEGRQVESKRNAS